MSEQLDREQHSDMDLLWRLVQLAATDRVRYREIRKVMWALFVENSHRKSKTSDRPSISS